VTNGWGYDFDYTWSHAIDNGSSSESSLANTGVNGIGGVGLQDAFHPDAFLGPADYDTRHNISANAVFQLPVGKGKALLSGVPMWLDEIVGGWQLSTLYSFHTGTPLNCVVSGVYNVNYLSSSYCILAPGATVPSSGSVTFDQNGIPSIFSNTNVYKDFVAGYPGIVGNRGILRGPHFWNDDLAISKFFRLPKEGYRLQLRGEAYNLLNHENFGNPALSTSSTGVVTPGVNISTPTLFGEITATSQASAPRVLQLALRFEF